jgi:hypothetical protein
MAVLLALVAGTVWWWKATFVRVPTKVWVRESGEARLRPFLAAERFAERMGVSAKELRSVPELDALAAGGVLLLANQRQSLDRQHVERVLAWVQAGGHLIAEAEYLGVADPLFDQLAVRRSAPAWRSSRRPAGCCFARGRRIRCASRASSAATAWSPSPPASTSCTTTRSARRTTPISCGG